MTINKIALSAVAAVMMSTASFAGTVTTTNAGLISSELLSYTDVNLSNISSSAVYTPASIPAGSLKNPIFKFTFGNVKSLVADANLSVYQVLDGNDTNFTAANLTQVAGTPTVSGANSEVISFNAISSSTYVYNNKKYILRDGNTTDNSVAGLKATITQGSTSDATLAAALYSGDSQALNDSAAASTVATIGKEFSATVSQALNARIDAANSFFKFKDQGEDNASTASTVKDTLILKVTRNATIAGLNTPLINLITFSDTNLTASGYSTVATYNSVNPTSTANDYNVTNSAQAAAAASTTAASYLLQYTVPGTKKIEKTLFGASMFVTATGTTSKFAIVTKTSSNAGSWTIYGYNAQIPNVSGLSTHNTTMKFTNRSSLNTNIYFTLIDPDGTVATLNSVDNTSLATLNAGTTGTYKASDLVALITDTNFDATGSFSVEVSIPTTPTSVYGMASFKNTTLGHFKDLPVYNSSTMTY